MINSWVPSAAFLSAEGYDVIGDIHGCANTLERLLHKLGYSKDSGVFTHQTRKAVFLGDVVDRGPHIREALHLVKDMMDHDQAVCLMGNHEYNAIGYTTLDPTQDGVYLREHNTRHNRLIAETLEQFASYPEEWRGFLEWFKGLPLFIELPGMRAVHACWDEQLIQAYQERYQSNCVDLDFIVASQVKSSFAGQVMDRLTRGTDLNLPEGMVLHSNDGYARTAFRTKFWSKSPHTYRDVVFQPDPLPEPVAARILSEVERSQLIHYPEGACPVFVGHYWLQGRPRALQKNLACLDYSAVKYGRLAAYRFDGEQALSDSKFVWVYVDPE